MNIFIILLLIVSFHASAQERVVGKTYPISEPNPYQEIEQRAAKIDLNKIKNDVLKKQTFINQFRVEQLPRTLESNNRIITPSAKAFTDIHNSDGSILYPKGFEFNPLDYRKFSGRIVVIDQKDIGLFEIKLNDTVIINDGDIRKSSDLIGQPVFILDKLSKNTLKDLRAVPTIIEQVGNQLKYIEIENENNNDA